MSGPVHGEPTDGRARILGRVRGAVHERPREPRPEAFAGWRPEPPDADPVTGFVRMFERAGGEVARLGAESELAGWLAALPATAGGTAAGAGVAAEALGAAPTAAPEDAAVGVSRARGAVAETGSLLLDARDGRRVQLLPPTHVVLVREREVHATLAGALEALRADLPSAVGLHSGPSKSADIGQILVQGVHGPGRVIALLIPETR